MQQCKDYIVNILDYIDKTKNILPERLYVGINDLANTTAIKMRDFGDALTGKADPHNSTMQIQHFKIIQNLRLNFPEKYKQLVFFATIYPTLNYDARKTQILSFFKKF